MDKICVFAGTSEGREITDFLSKLSADITVCVATEYGESLIENEKVTIHSGRMDKQQMIDFFLENKFVLVIDATHPYAQVVTENVYSACDETNIEYVRVSRDSFDYENCVLVDDTESAVEYLKTTNGNILSTIGSKELEKFIDCGFLDRFYARVLPLDASLDLCKKADIAPSHIIAMQGPFTCELNKAMINALNIKVMLTKDGGKNGGFEEKVKVAKETNIQLIVIKKPEQKDGLSVNGLEKIMTERYPKEQEVCIIACGVGSINLMTKECQEYLQNADVIIGAKRLTDELAFENKIIFNEIYSEKIADIIEKNKNYPKIAVVFTGDIGFYSGAKKLYDKLKGINVRTICGISSPIYLCSKLHTEWEDVKLVSLHGREKNIISIIRDNKKVFTLLDGKNNVNELCKKLCDYDMGDVLVNIGENLSYQNEKITKGMAKDFVNSQFNSLTCALIINEKANSVLKFGICDDEFLRVEKVPMTKAEVRAVTLAKLQLEKSSVVYDIGAGTGSVSIEMAINAVEGTVFAVEKNEKALPVIVENKKKFKADNLKIIEGIAPDSLSDLPSPTHVFIGGSSGNLREIVNVILEKNPKTRFVLNTVTLETLAEAVEIMKDFEHTEIVEVASAKARKLGKYNLMTANNPIYIITFQN